MLKLLYRLPGGESSNLTLQADAVRNEAIRMAQMSCES